ncbi:hypothetical protein [Ferrimonas pelagia]
MKRGCLYKNFLQPDVSGIVVQLAPDSLMTDQRHVSQRGDG